MLSDLHIELSRWDLPDPAPDCDVLIAVGDIHDPGSEGVRWLAGRTEGRGVISSLVSAFNSDAVKLTS